MSYEEEAEDYSDKMKEEARFEQEMEDQAREKREQQERWDDSNNSVEDD